MELRDFIEHSPENDIVVQFALRDIDGKALSEALVGWSEEEREIVYRNMSKRAVKLIKEDVKALEGEVGRGTVAEGQSLFLQKLAKFRKHLAADDPRGEADAPELDFSTRWAVLASFIGLAKYQRKAGVLAIEPLLGRVADPLARKALEYAVEDWDPMLARELLEKRKKSLLAEEELRLDAILEGMDSLIAGDRPSVLEEKVRTAAGL